MREIANNIFKSPRTVEDYIENLKIKFSCTRKSVLIKKIWDELFYSIDLQALLFDEVMEKNNQKKE